MLPPNHPSLRLCVQYSLIQKLGIADTSLATRAVSTPPTREEPFLSDVNMLSRRNVADREAYRTGKDIHYTEWSVPYSRDTVGSSSAVVWSLGAASDRACDSCNLNRRATHMSIFSSAFETLVSSSMFTGSTVRVIEKN
jgi:hypothetical protein